MKTQNVIQASANIIRITQLKKGDVYKRVEEANYGGASIRYGVVIDILNGGEKGFIESIEYTKSYSSIEAVVKVFTGNDDIAIFPTTIEEVNEHLNGCIDSIQKSIDQKEKDLEKEMKCLEDAKKFVSGETSKKLTEPDFVSLSQEVTSLLSDSSPSSHA